MGELVDANRRYLDRDMAGHCQNGLDLSGVCLEVTLHFMMKVAPGGPKNVGSLRQLLNLSGCPPGQVPVRRPPDWRQIVSRSSAERYTIRASSKPAWDDPKADIPGRSIRKSSHSATLEPRRALGDESGHALAEVIGAKCTRLQRSFPLQLGWQVVSEAGIERFLDHAIGGRRHGG